MFKNFAKLFGISSGGSVTVNGNTYRGSNVSIINGVVTVDGVVQGDPLNGPITITVQGSVGSIETSSGDVNVTGDSQNITAVSGDVRVGGNSGYIETVSGDVSVKGSVNGKISTVSGDVTK